MLFPLPPLPGAHFPSHLPRLNPPHSTFQHRPCSLSQGPGICPRDSQPLCLALVTVGTGHVACDLCPLPPPDCRSQSREQVSYPMALAKYPPREWAAPHLSHLSCEMGLTGRAKREEMLTDPGSHRVPGNQALLSVGELVLQMGRATFVTLSWPRNSWGAH